MTRRADQVTTLQAVLGLLGVVAAVAALVTGLDRARPPQNPEAVRLAQELAGAPPLLEARQPGAPVCPEVRQPLSEEVTSTLLVECPTHYDRRTVSYTGEVVSAVLRRDGYAWVQLNDDAYATSLGPLPSHGVAAGANSGIGVAIPLEAADRITAVGGPEVRGDRLTVRGTFFAADPADGGGTTIRADQVVAREAGGPAPEQAKPGRRLTAAALLLVTLVVAGLAYRAPLRRMTAYLPWVRTAVRLARDVVGR